MYYTSSSDSQTSVISVTSRRILTACCSGVHAGACSPFGGCDHSRRRRPHRHGGGCNGCSGRCDCAADRDPFHWFRRTRLTATAVVAPAADSCAPAGAVVGCTRRSHCCPTRGLPAPHPTSNLTWATSCPTSFLSPTPPQMRFASVHCCHHKKRRLCRQMCYAVYVCHEHPAWLSTMLHQE